MVKYLKSVYNCHVYKIERKELRLLASILLIMLLAVLPILTGCDLGVIGKSDGEYQQWQEEYQEWADEYGAGWQAYQDELANPDSQKKDKKRSSSKSKQPCSGCDSK